MPTTTETRVNDLIINKMSRAQFDALQEKSPTELYIVEGDSNAIYAEQITALPTAAEGNLGKVYQYIGATDANYTQNYFYKCVSSGSPAVYSWQQVNVQPAVDPLPSQSGNAGKFLTTDGTDASWSDKPLINKTTSANALAIGDLSTAPSQSVSIGCQSTSSASYTVSVGYQASANQFDAVALGKQAVVTNNGGGSIALGGNANVTAANACLINTSRASKTLNTRGVLQYSNNYGDYVLLNADGTIPEARLADTTGATSGQALVLDSNLNATWTTVDSLPSQTGQSGKVLGTNGSAASWEEPTTVTFRTWVEE